MISVTFKVSFLSRIYDINVFNGLNEIMDREVTSIIKKMKHWIPAKERGKPVSSDKFRLYILLKSNSTVQSGPIERIVDFTE